MTLHAELVDDSITPNQLPDVQWLRRYRADGCLAGDPILLSIGETWDRTPKELVAALADARPCSHGYQLSMYGLPRLRRGLVRYLATTHRLDHDDGRWETAVSWTGTRGAMRDFAEYLARSGTGRSGTALAVGPSWDYAGVVEPFGFAMDYLEPAIADGLLPTRAHVTDYAERTTDALGLVILNAQHNPTGANWSPDTVRALVELAVDRHAAVLIDDAYYGLVDPDDRPTSALRILLDVLGDRPSALPWMAVRSLGKQFNCNGWALGTVVAEPRFLDYFVNEVRARHTYNHAGHLQEAMATWMEDEATVEAYLAAERAFYRGSREVVTARLRAANVAPEQTISGPASPYLLYPVPAAARSTSGTEYLERCATLAGVLLSDAWPLARQSARPAGDHVRMFLGHGQDALLDACDRLERFGLLAN